MPETPAVAASSSAGSTRPGAAHSDLEVVVPKPYHRVVLKLSGEVFGGGGLLIP